MQWSHLSWLPQIPHLSEAHNLAKPNTFFSSCPANPISHSQKHFRELGNVVLGGNLKLQPSGHMPRGCSHASDMVCTHVRKVAILSYFFSGLHLLFPEHIAIVSSGKLCPNTCHHHQWYIYVCIHCMHACGSSRKVSETMLIKNPLRVGRKLPQVVLIACSSDCL